MGHVDGAVVTGSHGRAVGPWPACTTKGHEKVFVDCLVGNKQRGAEGLMIMRKVGRREMQQLKEIIAVGEVARMD